MSVEASDVPELQGKTPISYLQELCNKRGITPQYDLIANEGAVHEPLFVFRVTAGEYTGNGKGTSKKKAKHNAAVDVLNQMVGLPVGSLVAQPNANTNGDSSSNGHFGVDSKDNDARNPIGELQEMTQKKMWPPPVYDFTDEIGPAHAREFVCVVKLFNVTEQAVGKSKKLAKRNAALAMLNAVRQGFVEPMIMSGENDEYGEDDAIHMASAMLEGGPRAANGDINKVRKKISPMFQTSSKRTKLGPVLESLQTLSVDELKTIDVGKKLEELGREQSFVVTYTTLPNLSHSGCHQCITELSTTPLTVCFGSSPESPEEAQRLAALDALVHCRTMTARTNT